jgi:hypothetical protein
MPYDGGSYQDTVARRMLGVLGENGEHWGRGYRDDGRGNHCLIGAYEAATCAHPMICEEIELAPLAAAVKRAGGDPRGIMDRPVDSAADEFTPWTIAHWNNEVAKWPDIKLALEFYHEAELAGECVS